MEEKYNLRIDHIGIFNHSNTQVWREKEKPRKDNANEWLEPQKENVENCQVRVIWELKSLKEIHSSLCQVTELCQGRWELKRGCLDLKLFDDLSERYIN